MLVNICEACIFNIILISENLIYINVNMEVVIKFTT